MVSQLVIWGKFSSNLVTITVLSKNHKGAKDYAIHVQKFINKELQFDAILGPFRENPFNCNVCISPLNTVQKKDSEERRIILDLSYPKDNSINDFVSKDFYLGQKINLTYPGVDDLVAIVKTKGRGCLLFKRDLSRAYRQLSLDPGDASLLGYSFNGFMYFDKVLSFGLRMLHTLCREFQIMSNLVATFSIF